MNYLIPFSRLNDHIKIASVKGPLKVDLRYDELLGLVKLLLGAVTVDEAWYCEMYPDVADAVASGVYASAKQHFVENGYVEGRHPCAMAVNETWYRQQYPDVNERIRSGDLPSAQEHFTKHGYDEGRRPEPP